MVPEPTVSLVILAGAFVYAVGLLTIGLIIGRARSRRTKPSSKASPAKPLMAIAGSLTPQETLLALAMIALTQSLGLIFICGSAFLPGIGLSLLIFVLAIGVWRGFDALSGGTQGAILALYFTAFAVPIPNAGDWRQRLTVRLLVWSVFSCWILVAYFKRRKRKNDLGSPLHDPQLDASV